MNVTFEESVCRERQGEIVDLLREFDIVELRAGCRIAFLPGGACNENYLVAGIGGSRFVLRLAGLEVDRFNWDRKKGADAHRSAAAAGVAPELVAIRLPEGHSVARWVDGPILTPDRIRDPGMLEAVGETLRKLHDGPWIEGTWSVFDDIRGYTATAYSEQLELPDDYDELLRRVGAVKTVFEAVDAPDGMCHNDLQLQNFIIGGDRLWVLDFEFAGRGNRYFDLGNTAVNAELSDEELRPFLGRYFGRIDSIEMARTKLMMFMAAFREAVWAVLAAPVLTLDWDYVAWAAEYFRRSRVWSDGKAFEQTLMAARG